MDHRRGYLRLSIGNLTIYTRRPRPAPHALPVWCNYGSPGSAADAHAETLSLPHPRPPQRPQLAFLLISSLFGVRTPWCEEAKIPFWEGRPRARAGRGTQRRPSPPPPPTGYPAFFPWLQEKQTPAFSSTERDTQRRGVPQPSGPPRSLQERAEPRSLDRSRKRPGRTGAEMARRGGTRASRDARSWERMSSKLVAARAWMEGW